ncbi:CheB methylesterase domain-containing protein [Hymenobacter weizhouensis]|uniref:CheB methylesterase domain-containing protein n=1 Tax=Hymenobacter sp. YIM 151500-1 TaxID=2987689 RepID=UPI002227052C|nr:CheB methylesterase domain-containing protein [Hymenobacter sp. YIM 151500-1]UYZ64441.1 CheB methylesterase domain-containing protein [Hymenobacter sp. YIM 151500-1]
MLGSFPAPLRQELTRLLNSEPTLWVVGAAATPDELPALAQRLRPGMVIVPESQLLLLPELRRRCPVPVLVYRSSPIPAGVPWEAFGLGVSDYLPPRPAAPAALAEWHRDVKRKVQAARPASRPDAAALRHPAVPLSPPGLVVVGGSTGGAPAVEVVLRQLPLDFPWAILVAVHLPAQFTATLVERLRRATSLTVEAAASGTRLQAGRVLVAPGGCNLVVQPTRNSPWPGWQTEVLGETSLDVPSVDMLMASAARAAGRQVLGVVLTGLGTDGTQGAQAIRQQGGTVVAQDEATSQVFGMPKAVIQAGHASVVLPLPAIAGYVVQHTRSLAPSRAARTSSFQPAATR